MCLKPYDLSPMIRFLSTFTMHLFNPRTRASLLGVGRLKKLGRKNAKGNPQSVIRPTLSILHRATIQRAKALTVRQVFLTYSRVYKTTPANRL